MSHSSVMRMETDKDADVDVEVYLWVQMRMQGMRYAVKRYVVKHSVGTYMYMSRSVQTWSR